MSKSSTTNKSSVRILCKNAAILLLLIHCFACNSDNNDIIDGDTDLDSENQTESEAELDDQDMSEATESEPAEEDLSEQTEVTPIDPELTVDDITLTFNEEISPELPAGVRVRVATYNIYGGNFVDSYDEIGDFLKTLDLDLVGLEECPTEAVEPIAQSGGFEYSYKGEGGKAMFSKTPLSDIQTYSLPGGGSRSLLHAITEIEGVTISFYVAHISWNTDGDLQCRTIVDDILKNDQHERIILTGDFNDEIYSKQINILEEVLQDSASTIGWFPGERISWPSYGFDGHEGSQLIDLVFFRKDFPAIVIDVDVINQKYILSDHKPVVAELMFPVKDAVAYTTDPYQSYRDIWRDFPNASELPANLLSNPGAEDDLQGWEIFGDAKAEEEREQHKAHSGNKFFTGFSIAPDEETLHSGGSQTVDISDKAQIINESRGRLYISAQITTGYNIIEGETGTATEGMTSNSPKPYDEGEIIIEALDSENKLLHRITSKRRDTLDWHPFAKTMDLPPNTAKIKYNWMSHHKSWNGKSNDAMFDDLYLGFTELETPHNLVGSNLLSNIGAETGDLAGWQSDVWESLLDLKMYGLAIYQSLSFSGKNYFYAGGTQYLDPGQPGKSVISQKMDLSAYRSEITSGNMALNWGGWFRSLGAQVNKEGKNPNAEISVNLEIYNADGSLWNTVESEPIYAAEWTKLENLTLIPAGTSSVNLVISTDVEAINSGAFMDEVFALPVKVEK